MQIRSSFFRAACSQLAAKAPRSNKFALSFEKPDDKLEWKQMVSINQAIGSDQNVVSGMKLMLHAGIVHNLCVARLLWSFGFNFEQLKVVNTLVWFEFRSRLEVAVASER